MIPGIETILYLIGAAFVGALGKDLYDKSNTTRCSRRCSVASKIRSNCSKLMELNKYPVIPLHSLEIHITSALRDHGGGVWIFGAPEGSGKSTYLNHCIELFRKESQQNRLVCTFRGVNILKNRNLHLVLGVPLLESISDYIPHGTVIVIDQVDCQIEAIDSLVAEYIVELATDSRNSKCYSVIICVSCPQVMLALLKLNNMEKIKDICHPRAMQWRPQETEQYIEKVFLTWNKSQKNNLLDACEISNSPSVLYNAHKAMETGNYSVDEIVDFARNWDKLKGDRWSQYDDVLAGHPFLKSLERVSPQGLDSQLGLGKRKTQ
jgi:hypothetical protein